MNLRAPVQRLWLIILAAAAALVGLLTALKSVDPNSSAHGVLFVLFTVAALAVVGFAWSLVSALIANRRAER